MASITKEKSTISITFGDVCENHAGMQKIGQLAESGLSLDDIAVKNGTIIDLKDLLKDEKNLKLDDIDDAKLVVIENSLDKILGKNKADSLFEEMKGYTYDKKAFMRGRVVNKHARWNHCFADFAQNSDFEHGKGTIVNFADTKIVNDIRKELPKIFGDKVKNIVAETNLYYDVDKTYIGFHGDTERKIVVCVRLGADFPIHYQWYYKNKPIGKRFTKILKHGDIYAMSEKAVGFDWKKSSKYTLRHAAGYDYNVNK